MRRGHRLYTFIVVLLGAAIIFMAAVLLFYVQGVEVEGNEYVSDDAIAQMVKSDRYSVNSLYVCAKYALGKGETLPCLESVSVGLKKPWVLRVRVKERQIVGFIYGEGQEYAYFDREGLIVKKDAEYIEGVPYIEGLETESAELYQPIKSEDSDVFEEILTTTRELKRNEIAAEKIILRGEDIYIYIGQICIELGSSVTPEKIAQIPPIMENLTEQAGTLHLENYSEDSGTITFKIGEFPE